MIDRQHGKLIFECDSCDQVFEPETADFVEAWNSAKESGWRSQKIADVWLHGCPTCGVPT